MSSLQNDPLVVDRPKFKHDPLKLEANEIRLIKVLPIDKDDPQTVRCRVMHTPLVETLVFWTLSYTWGCPDNPQKIMLNDAISQAGINLFRFLQTAQMDDEIQKYWIWIDQLCIDQGNVRERNHQVARMANIYRISRRTLIWLDPHTLSNVIEFHPTLIMNQYWTRLWIIQEVLLSQNRQLVFQDRKIWWDEVSYFGKPGAAFNIMLPGDKIQTWEKLMRSANWEDHISMLLDTDVGQRRKFQSWRQALEYTKKSGCTDKRDRVFGLLGLVTVPIRVIPDYSKRSDQVLIDVLLAEISASLPPITSDELVGLNQTLAASLGLQKGLPEEVLLVVMQMAWSRWGKTDDRLRPRVEVMEEVRAFIRNNMEEHRRRYGRNGWCDLKGLPETFLDSYLEKWVTYKAIYIGLGCWREFRIDTLRIWHELGLHRSFKQPEMPATGFPGKQRLSRKYHRKRAPLGPLVSAIFILKTLRKYQRIERRVKRDNGKQWEHTTGYMQIIASQLLDHDSEGWPKYWPSSHKHREHQRKLTRPITTPLCRHNLEQAVTGRLMQAFNV